MRRLGKLIAGTAAATLALSSLAAPVLAARSPATVVLVHGIPGATLEVCASGNELMKDFRYGNHMRTRLDAGAYQLAVRAAAPGTCSGELVAKKRLVVADGQRLTIVASFRRAAPALLVFDDGEILESISGSAMPAFGVVQHAARLGALDFYMAAPLTPGVSDTTPMASGLRKRQQLGGPTDPGALVLWMNRVDEPQPVIGPELVQMRAGKLNHLVAVGTHPFNARFVVFRTGLDS
jgi:hypothetical protein